MPPVIYRNIEITIPDAVVSRQVQEKLFSVGFNWSVGSNRVYEDAHVIYTNNRLMMTEDMLTDVTRRFVRRSVPYEYVISL